MSIVVMPIPITSLAHASLTGVTADQHHAGAHVPESHTDQAATAAELDTLTDGSDADSLHDHALSTREVTGTYTGDGTLSLVISGLGITVQDVDIFHRGTIAGEIPSNGWCYTSTTIVDDSAFANGISINYRLAANGFDYRTDSIIALSSGSFTVDDEGADNHPNKNSNVYNFIARGTPT